jgi:hypothetical protein
MSDASTISLSGSSEGVVISRFTVSSAIVQLGPQTMRFYPDWCFDLMIRIRGARVGRVRFIFQLLRLGAPYVDVGYFCVTAPAFHLVCGLQHRSVQNP